MKKVLIFLVFLCSFSISDDNIINMKNCEQIKLSKYTTLVSCHKNDYLVEYRNIDDDEKDRVKKVTLITNKEQVVIKNIGR